MNGAAVEPVAWDRRQWWSVLALVFIVQLVLIFWLGERGSRPARPSGPAPTLRMAGRTGADFLALQDPTLFALPHRQGFSGPAWLEVLPVESHPFVWSESNRWLEPSLAQLGAPFEQFLETNSFIPFDGTAPPEPALTPSEVAQSEVLRQQSTLRLADGLAGRRLLTPLKLPSWTNSELLTSSVVQVGVDASGVPFGFTPLSRSGSQEADDFALEQARAARFESFVGRGPQKPTNPLDGLSWGKLIFEWHTVTVAPSNPPPP
ncbi:MAG TPA: hypothetical protein VN578_16945 [Candidatus Binatia bacterium]|jgi:hypothetical protein|nr:hypothetical protein [Candidatus Binatia bacterium]